MVLSIERQVIRRDGTHTTLDVSKIKAVAKACTEGLNANPVELESGMSARLRNGISTREIQSNLIECALRLTTIEEPAWRYVAGRLLMWGVRKDASVAGYGYEEEFATYIDKQVKKGVYDSLIQNEYSVDELTEAGQWIDERLDWDYDYAGASLWQHRYLLPNELPQQAYCTIALLLALPEAPDRRMGYAEKFYHAISQRKISLATPILLNLRRPNGNLASCFITAAEDSLTSIIKNISDFAEISKQGGGAGINLCRIRAKGSWIKKVKNASGGVVPWIKIINDVAVAVDQGGKRAGAATVGIGVYHLDVLDFLEMQTEHGDQRQKCYDIYPQLIIPDEFMRRVKKDELWSLVDPYEIRTVLGIELAELWGTRFESAYQEIETAIDAGVITLTRSIPARDLFKRIMRSQFETGLPYLTFKDEINRRNPNQHAGYIPQVNLCTESFSNVLPHSQAHTCNLVSLNLANISDDLPDLSRLAVRLLDNTIELSTPPIPESKTHNTLYRTIGVGAMGLADWLAFRHFKYSEGHSIVEQLFEVIAFHCIDASSDLAVERGAYPLFEGSEWSKGRLLARSIEDIAHDASAFTPGEWRGLAHKVSQQGIRNGQLLAIAPNTSTAPLQGCTASVLPPFSRFNDEKNSKGSVTVAPPYVEERFWHYEENKSLNQQVVVDMVAAIQKWVDTGISMELVFDPNKGVEAKNVYEILLSAWEQRVKAIYYIRTIQKDKEVCDACAG